MIALVSGWRLVVVLATICLLAAAVGIAGVVAILEVDWRLSRRSSRRRFAAPVDDAVFRRIDNS